MNKMTVRRIAPMAALSALILMSAQPAFAADFPPSAPLPGCPGFDITISGTGGDLKTKEIPDKNGATRTITGGNGFILTFTNTTTGRTVTVPTNGSVTFQTTNPDGSITYVLTGQNVFIYFPTDTGGARTILYTGRAVITNDVNGVSTLQSASGQQTDLCTQLAG